jgi:hypothetical protein
MLPNHATQTDPYLHEIKGASTAPLGWVPTANGAGSAPFAAPITGGSGSVVKTQTTLSQALLTGTTTIPFDNTIPQTTEGTNFFSVAWTPAAIGNLIRIETTIFGAYSVAAHVIAALFQDATANALAAISMQTTTTNQDVHLTLVYQFTAVSTSSTTIKLNIGGSTAGTFTLNGNAGASVFGGTATSSFRITEIKA